MGSTPQYQSEMTYHMIVIIRFCVILFSNWPLMATLDFTPFKKRSKLTKVHPADSESRHPEL